MINAQNKDETMKITVLDLITIENKQLIELTKT